MSCSALYTPSLREYVEKTTMYTCVKFESFFINFTYCGVQLYTCMCIEGTSSCNCKFFFTAVKILKNEAINIKNIPSAFFLPVLFLANSTQSTFLPPSIHPTRTLFVQFYTGKVTRHPPKQNVTDHHINLFNTIQ